jgi:predicted GNAT family N-acyltransferase
LEAADGVEVRLARDQGEVDDAQALRARVFSAEQESAAEAEPDGLDAAATHVVAMLRGNLVGACRLRYPRGRGRIERVAVVDAVRRTGIGRRLLAAAEDEAARRGARQMTLHAQRSLEPFFAACGYRTEGEPFLEQGTPRLLMSKPLPSA